MAAKFTAPDPRVVLALADKSKHGQMYYVRVKAESSVRPELIYKVLSAWGDVQGYSPLVHTYVVTSHEDLCARLASSTWVEHVEPQEVRLTPRDN